MQGEWTRKPQGDASVVFVHGILSSGKTCWRHKSGGYWPELLKDEPEFGSLGIYVFTYQTGFFSGSYRLGDVVDALKEQMRLDRVLESDRVIFVCHSMGGLVVRKFIVERATELIAEDKKIGLFLVASPSLGATYADWLSGLAKLVGHAQADALRFIRNNHWLMDLDKEFINLKEGGRLKIKGKELIEDRFVVLWKFFQRQVVEPFSGAKYFGEPYKVPKSDHFSIAKPKDKNEIQHRLLRKFISDMDGEYSQDALGDRKRQLTPMLETVERQSLKQLEHFRREVINTLAHLECHAKLIAEDAAVLRFLMDSKNKSAQAKAHQVLLNHAGIGPYATTFILNSDGLCVENSRHVLSIGKDYSFRPYFKDSMQNKIGRFPAIGVTSGVLGHHIAYPARHDGETIGAACIEVDLEQIAIQSNAFVYTETGRANIDWIRVLADENGVIMLSTEASWVYRTIMKIPEETLQRARTQYPGYQLSEIERFESSDTALFSSLMPNVAIRGLRWKNSFGDLENRIFAIRESQIAGGWKVLIFWRLPTSSP
jgi:hypothetical protein